MKLVTFTYNNVTHIGVLRGEERNQSVIDLNLFDSTLPSDLAKFLGEGEPAHKKALNALKIADKLVIIPLDAVKLEAPVPVPGKILCVGLNYRDHVEESKMAIPEYPTIFAKYSNVVTGPYDPILMPRVTKQVDWEGELGVVIGKTGKYISKEKALDYVGGYVVFNDVSGRDYQLRTSQWTIGKTFDTFGPMGPVLVTSDEIPDPAGLDIRTFVNEIKVQESNTRYLIFDVASLVSFLSQVMTLQPGDLISTGTPAGVGNSRDPKWFLKPGDVVRVEIEKIGSIRNIVIED